MWLRVDWRIFTVLSQHILLLLFTVITFLPGGSSPYTSRNKTEEQNILQQNKTKTHYKQYKTKSIQLHIIITTPTRYKTHTYTHPLYEGQAGLRKI
jgi:hypothetical protein